MIFKVHPPSKTLTAIIQCFLETDSRGKIETETHTLSPNGFPGIFFNFGVPGKLVIKESINTPSVSVFGQIDRHFTVINTQGYYSLGVLLKSTVLSNLFRLNMASLTNLAIDGALIHKELHELHQQMEAIPDVAGKITLVEDYLLCRISRQSVKFPFADHAVSIMERHAEIKIGQVARDIF